ncbi:DNA gyrase subunit A [Micromonospora sp. NPDC051141]|uniref:DNA gyrase subunit A n=1 Tax=Micromonospora sp. NPDC051141 TaxID=3364284 RepID=UPI0037B0A5F5
MTDLPESTPNEPEAPETLAAVVQHDRIEPVGLEVEMQRSYLDYAMSVIVGRALPDVRDGLKPVHRKILYAMFDSGYRPDRGYVKCSRVVGDVMGQFHPHGDSAIYDALVRMAQPWSLRYPLVDGNGNFGSPGNDPAAAMRYCVAGDTCVRLADGAEVPIASLVPGAEPSSEIPIDLKVEGLVGEPARASMFFHSGEHPTLRITTRDGDTLTGTHNHPVLCLVAGPDGESHLRWRLLSELKPSDVVARAGSGADVVAPAATSAQDLEDPARKLPWAVPTTAFRYAVIADVADAGIQPVYSIRVDTDDHSFISDGFVSHNTECKLDPLAMEMLRDIDEDTVDLQDNYDGRAKEPTILPSRIPNLLINGSEGIAVGMATKIPPHNLREIGAAVQWCLEHPEADEATTLEALLEIVKGPDFPTYGLIVGQQAIQDAYRTGRGSIRMRAVVEVEEDKRGRPALVVSELPYQVNPDNLAERIAELIKEGKLAGIADIRDESSGRTGMRIVLVLKRDAVAKVVLNNLYKHTQLQETFGANMLALVDGVPRTLNLAQFIRYYVEHQIEVIRRRTAFRLRKAEERAHILRGLSKALDALDEVIALIRRSPTVEDARQGLIRLLEIDEVQATAILDMQLRRLAALERQRILDDLAKLEIEIADLKDILAKPERQRKIVSDELGEIVAKWGDDRRTKIVPFDGEVSMEDLIAREDVVVTITRTGYAKRTKVDLYRSQRRGGKGVSGATLRQDDIVSHFFVCSTHDWILFFTNKGRVYRAKAYELPEASRVAKGQHVANLLAFQPDEQIAQIIEIPNYQVAPYLVLATKNGLVKKTRLEEFDSNRSGGIIAVNLRDEDELVGAVLVAPEDDLLLVSKNAQAIRFNATDEALRPMGRATSGVIGMRFSGEDELLAVEVVREGLDVLVATNGGFAKRTPIEEYPVQGRGGKGVLTAKITERRGGLVGAVVIDPEDELFAITSNGGVIRTPVKPVRRTRDRNTMGVKLMDLPDGVTIVAIARNADEPDEQD